MKQSWAILPAPPQSFLDEHPELQPVVATLLYHRDITTAEAIDEFLHPDYTRDIHDPFLFTQMEQAVARVLDAVANDEAIMIHGDYDADGVSASVILATVLKDIGARDVDVFLPHREIDGYGLNMNTVELFEQSEKDLIITCDCGVSNVQEITAAQEKKIDVIVTDHHAIPETLPPAHAIIHPKLPDETYPDKNLAGAGVAFKLAQALLQRHKEQGKELHSGMSHEACEKWLLGMVAIATVADMVPLIGESRTLTKYGLIVLNKTKRIGLQKLLLESRLMHDDGSLKKEITADVIGFQIAPRINAAGRMDHANVAYNLMMTEDPIEATDLAYELDQNNKDRQQLVEQMLEAAEMQLKNQDKEPILIVVGKGWAPGVIGLIASRLKERYYKPTLAFADTDGTLMASGRSVDGFNMIEALQAIPDQFEKFGGHPMACGFTLSPDTTLEAFKEKLLKQFQQQTNGEQPEPELRIEADVALNEITWNLYDQLQLFEPFGKDNPKPLYVSKALEVTQVKAMGKNNQHIALFVKSGTVIKKMVGWNYCHESRAKEENWCAVLKPGDLVDVVFDIGVNEWNGNRDLQLTIRDLRRS